MRLRAVVALLALGLSLPLVAQEGAPPAGPGGMSPAPDLTLTDAPAPPPPALEPEHLKLLTFNAGLARGAVLYSDERLPHIAEALKASDADVICLQEVWAEADAQALSEAVAATHPHTFSERTTDDSEATTPCGIIKTLRMSRCVTKKCEAAGISIFDCVGAEGVCEGRYQALDDDCQRCLGANTSDPSQCAIGGAQAFAWGGHNGLLLLSRIPLESPRYVPMDAELVRRGALVADVGDYRVLCTHLTADLGMLPYPPEAAAVSWEEEHAAQLGSLAEAAGEGCGILMGDLNAGETREGAGGLMLNGEFEANFRQLGPLGFSEPFEAPSCTWCGENPLAGGTHNAYIDHIMFKGCPEGLKVTYGRTLDAPLTLPEKAKAMRLSDHYGVEAEIGGAAK